jgi:hypothetical protein
LRLTAAEGGQPSRALTFDQRLACFSDKPRFLPEAGQGFRFSNQVIVKINDHIPCCHVTAARI